MTRDDLINILPAAASRADLFLDPLNAAMALWGIDTPARQSAFVAQILHETQGLTRLRENLNYSPEGLLATFNTARVTRFTRVDAYRCGRTADHPADQVAIANIAYAGRYGNGPMESGDGWRYRGGGAGHLTFRSNYGRCGAALGVDLLTHPELIERPDIACLSFAWFWVEGNARCANLNELADRGDIEGISRVVNGGDNGLAARVALFSKAMEVLA